ncbi:hypothetical protein HU200_058397 [Digitaria exilis]|uniref:C2H2-type domain-containing protein n=1 Tax=Digitaria exilis TaxID=1010633 RepID=A0A835E0N7_9POAL|nr:hypothetical protein HU200_058397 [Digitaria exilis]
MIDRYFSKADWYKTLVNLSSRSLELIILVLAMVSRLKCPCSYNLLIGELKNSHGVPRSSRLRDKRKNEGEIIIKETFVGNVIENNNFLSILLDKGPCIIIPEIEFPLPSFPTISQFKAEDMLAYGDVVDEIKGFEKMCESQSAGAAASSACNGRKLYETKFGTVNSSAFLLNSEIQSGVIEKGRSHQRVGLLDQGRLPCVQCGILSYACVAIIQPKEAAAQYVISQECMSSGAKHEQIMKPDATSNWIMTVPPPGHSFRTDDNTIHNVSSAQVSDRCRQLYTSSTHGCTSLGLLASAYESSDSDEEAEAPNISNNSANNNAANGVTNIQSSGTSIQNQNTNLQLYEEGCDSRATISPMKPVENRSIDMTQASKETAMSYPTDLEESLISYEKWSTHRDLDDDPNASGVKVNTSFGRAKGAMESDALTLLKYNKDSCRMHVFCLEHALETWTRLQQSGGANIMLLCHPGILHFLQPGISSLLIHNTFAEYPRAELEAKVIAEELGMKHAWKDITFKKATDEDIGRIRLALQDEDAEPTSSDWAVKMGINIYYSAKQSKSPLYSKQVPYNSIIYKAFAQENPDSFTDEEQQRSGTTRKKVAGSWCGKIWMSNQVHPLLAREREEQDHDTVYSKAMFSANSYDRIKEEPSTRSTSLIKRGLSKRISRRKEGDSVEKSRIKKKKCTASDVATFDQPRNFDDHDKHGGRDGIKSEDAQSPQQHHQHESQNINKKSSSKRRKDDKRHNNFYERHNDNGDIDYRLGIDSIENTTVDGWDNSPLQGLEAVKEESGAQLQGSKKKTSKCKGSDDLSRVEKRLQKSKKVSTKKHKNGKTNEQFQENHNKDNNVDLLHDNGDQATQDNCDEVPKQKIDDVKVKSRGKMHSGKRKAIRCETSDGLHIGDNEATFSYETEVCDSDKATLGNWEEIPKEKVHDVKVKSKMQSDKKKVSKRLGSDGLHNGDKGAKFSCDIEGCDMSFRTQQDLALHKRDICPVKGCKKKFFCHKYLLQHRKVHLDERPLMCSFTGCEKTFKWPWARTEHMRVHTGVRPYACTEPGCTQTFRFVSDFSRHKRKTGHSCDKKKKNST